MYMTWRPRDQVTLYHLTFMVDVTTKKYQSEPFSYSHHLFCSFVLAPMNIPLIHIFCMLTQISSKPPSNIMSHMTIFNIFPLTRLMTYCIHTVLEMSWGRRWKFFLWLTLSFIYCMPEWSSSCARVFSHKGHILIIFIQLFCRIWCKHKRSIIHVIWIMV